MGWSVTIKLSLTSVPVFQFIVGDAAKRLAKVAKVIEKGQHDAVLMHGENVPGIYIVAEGSVGVYPPGATRPLVTLPVGASFGEMSFLERSKASATIRAEVKGTKLVFLHQGELAALVDGDAELGRALYQGMALTLSQKLRTTTDRIAVELAAGRKLLQDLNTDAGEVVPVPDDLVRQNQQIADGLEKARRVLDEQIRKAPDKAASLQEATLAISEAKGRCAEFFPRLSRHVGVLSAFVKKMEDFIHLRD